eukprot:8307980-Pyramimonas_sp.AAC.1
MLRAPRGASKREAQLPAILDEVLFQLRQGLSSLVGLDQRGDGRIIALFREEPPGLGAPLC